MYSDARGSVKVVSTDPRVHPALRLNYHSSDQDRREWIEAVECAAVGSVMMMQRWEAGATTSWCALALSTSVVSRSRLALEWRGAEGTVLAGSRRAGVW
jgi:GMC oxidoreductase